MADYDKVRFHVAQVRHHSFVDTAWIEEGEDPATGIVEAAFEQMSTDVDITVAGVTMHAAAWKDPDHWSSDWEEVMPMESEQDVHEFIDGLVAQAREEG